MRRARVPSKVTRSTKLRGAQRSPELGLMSTDFRAPENLIFPALLTIETLHQGVKYVQRRRFGLFIVNFEHNFTLCSRDSFVNFERVIATENVIEAL